MRTVTGVVAAILCVTALALSAPQAVVGAVRTHVVQPGETLYRIALRYGVTLEALARANQIADPARLRVGQVLIIPSAPARGPSARGVMVAGTEVRAPRPIRVRRGPKTYFVTAAIVAVDTPLRIMAREGSWYAVQLPDGLSGWVALDDLRTVALPAATIPRPVRGGDIAREAMRYLGTPYLWGGESSRGVDCSGFVFVVLGPQVPGLARMNSFAYYQVGATVARGTEQPGDLVFFTTYAPGPSHVGIYAGESRFIHASSGAHRVVLSSLDDPYYGPRYLGARRLLAP